MSIENTSEEALDYGLEKLEERLEPYDESTEISNWEGTAGLIAGGVAYVLADEISESPGVVDFMVQKPYYMLAGASALAFTGALNGGASAYRKLASQANPLNIRNEFREGYEKGQLDATVAEISEAWTPRSLEDGQNMLEGQGFRSPTEEAREYLEKADRAVGRQSRYGSPRDPRALEGDEIGFFFHDVMRSVEDDSEIQQTILEEPVGDDTYAFAAFWESEQGLHGTNEHCLFGYRTE